jgi:hypothetical protein
MEHLVLEPSTNTHTMRCDSVVSKPLDELGGIAMKVRGKGVVLHGEHGVIVTEAPNVIKLTQQEFNPITKSLQNSYD